MKQRLQRILAMAFLELKVFTMFPVSCINFELVWDYLNYKNVLKKFTGCLIKKLDALKKGVVISLKFHIIHRIVVIMHEITSLKDCIVFYSLWELPVELVFELKCKLSRVLWRHLTVLFIIFKFHVDLLRKVCLSVMIVAS